MWTPLRWHLWPLVQYSVDLAQPHDGPLGRRRVLRGDYALNERLVVWLGIVAIDLTAKYYRPSPT